MDQLSYPAFRQVRREGDAVIGPAFSAQVCDGAEPGQRELCEGVVHRSEGVADCGDNPNGAASRFKGCQPVRLGGDSSPELLGQVPFAVTGTATSRRHTPTPRGIDVYTDGGAPCDPRGGRGDAELSP